ncbi:hypothetical protein NM688_g5878 [Phlebia brevispora]|uniref:Uncharacterized protein n=1 Tax=Phlebia brevispora TaxID=194682 RepID=A0ACC1SNA4_9APHY|nr:hypothetical protein NM688_g5878 [Phlebia brevispora]
MSFIQCFDQFCALVPDMQAVNQQMNKLNLKETDPSTPPARAVNATPAEIPEEDRLWVPWPPNPELRYQFFGWEFDDEWLMEIGRNVVKGDPTIREAQIVEIALAELRREVGMPHLHIEIVYPGDSTPWKRVTPYFSILGIIGYQRERISGDFRRRPTQAQADKLTKLTGGPPKWFIDVGPFW